MDITSHSPKNNKGTKRPRAYEPPVIWEVSQLLEDQKTMDHPALESAIFIVHGMGKQGWAETAAVLRKGFEDVTDVIRKWQEKSGVEKR